MSEPVIITGCARSGTSMIAGIVARCGFDFGKTCGPTAANRKGQYENNSIRTMVTKPYLKSIGCDPMGQWPLPRSEDVREYSTLRAEVRKILRDQRVDVEGARWAIKEAKACLVWQIWAKAFPEAKWVIVRRPDEDIVQSCLRTGFMRHFTNAEGWQKWIDVHKVRFAEILSACDAVEVWSDRVISSSEIEINKLTAFIGGHPNSDSIAKFISPELWRNGNGARNV